MHGVFVKVIKSFAVVGKDLLWWLALPVTKADLFEVILDVKADLQIVCAGIPTP